MAQNVFVDELMERIRSQVRTEARSSTPFSGASVLAKDEPRAADQILLRLNQHEPVTVATAPIPRELPEFTGVRVELETCIRALEKFGEVNPRHPGFVNDRVQNGKGILRRTLVWYTRPLRVFHTAVIRTLQQFMATLEKQQAMLGDTARHADVHAVERRVEDVEVGICHIHEVAEAAIAASEAQSSKTEAELEVLRKNVRDLEAQVVALRQQIKEAPGGTSTIAGATRRSI